MSVTGYMYNVNAARKLGELELQEGLTGNKSWHHQFKHSAYVYVGGLHTGMSEGDVVIVFSQFGEVVDCNLIRDKETGKPKGFAYICYEDQRSTVLAVDNMNGFQLLKRTLRVDHVDKYKAPKEFDENDLDENGDAKLLEYHATGAEGKGHRVYNVMDGQKKIDEIHRGKKGVPQGPSKPEDEDEAWAKAFEAGLQDEAEKSKKSGKEKKSVKKEKKDLKEMLKEAKRLTKEAKKVKKESKGKDKGKKKKAKSSSSDSSKSSCSSI